MFFLNYLNSTDPRQRRTWVSRVKASFSGWMARQDHSRSHSTTGTGTIFLYSWYSPPGHFQCLDFRASDWSKKATTTKWGWREMRRTQGTTEEKWIYSLGFNEFYNVCPTFQATSQKINNHNNMLDTNTIQISSFDLFSHEICLNIWLLYVIKVYKVFVHCIKLWVP